MSIVDEMQNILKNSPPIILCSDCGEKLNIYNIEVDHYLQITIDIDSCNCIMEDLLNKEE